MKTLLQSVFDSTDKLESQAKEKALQEAISKLPEDQRKILTLYYSNHIPIREISVEMGCSVTTTYSKLNRALFTLRNMFNPGVYKKMYDILYPETGRPIPQ